MHGNTRKKRNMYSIKTIALAAVLVLLAILLPIALSQQLEVDTCTIASPKVQKEVTLAVATDLHDSFFGEDQQELIAAIRAESPDALLLVGDMCENPDEMDGVRALVGGLAGEMPVLYTTGNHECLSGAEEQIKSALRELGATVLEGDSVALGGIRIAGTDDPLCLTRADWQAQIEGCRAQDETFTVLMAHRPERVDSYATGFDLVVSGHAHGGQIRIPGLLDGLWAPNQGWFPAYSSGLYPLEEGQLVVSRGLCKNVLPRLFNRPELMILHIVPEPD